MAPNLILYGHRQCVWQVLFFFFVLFLSLKKLADLGNAQALEKPHGYRVRVIAGPLKNQEFSKVLDVRPYNVEIAKELRNSGNRVENL